MPTTKLQLFRVNATITMPHQVPYHYNATIPAQDATHARHTTAYAIAAAWPGSTHTIQSITQLTDEEVRQLRAQLPPLPDALTS